jgi:hypothetical protein
MIPKLLLILSLLCPLLSYVRFRNLLHPHFVFTISWLFLLPLGAVTTPTPPLGLSSANLSSPENLKYNLDIIGFLLVLFLLTMFITPRPATGRRAMSILRNIVCSPNYGVTIAALGLSILFVEFGLQLYSCEWQLGDWLAYSLGPRGGGPWQPGSVGGSDFIFALVGTIFSQTCPVLLPLAVGKTRGILRICTGIGVALLLFITITIGAREPVALTILLLLVVWHYRISSAFVKFIGEGLLLVSFVVVTAVMVTYRANGLRTIKYDAGDTTIRYSQDDNYFRLVHALQLADENLAPSWNANYFIAATLLNPVPRYFWPEKPLLSQDFYGAWKPYYVTISFVGECIAMFGTAVGLSAALLIGLVYYGALRWSYSHLGRQFGVVLYICAATYVYSAERSIQNLGIFAPFIGFILLLFFFLQRRSAVQWAVAVPIRVNRHGTRFPALAIKKSERPFAVE